MSELNTILSLKETIKAKEETISCKDKEIKDIKESIFKVLQEIRDINESNDYSAPEVRKRKISELCTNTQYELYIDELDQKEKEPILNTDQSTKK